MSCFRNKTLPGIPSKQSQSKGRASSLGRCALLRYGALWESRANTHHLCRLCFGPAAEGKSRRRRSLRQASGEEPGVSFYKTLLGPMDISQSGDNSNLVTLRTVDRRQ
ncbi:hypothetical protein Rs2_48973 [Raphanus sativus]|nr:hypothetical protein Rs2_48973 [Raphanus sativus]